MKISVMLELMLINGNISNMTQVMYFYKEINL